MNIFLLKNKYYKKYYKLYKKKKKKINIDEYKNMKKKLLFLLKKNITLKNKKKIGLLINYFKIKKKIKKKKNIYEYNFITQKKYDNIGNIHPINIILNKIINIFLKLNFLIYEDKEIKNKWDNFISLNINNNHPSINKHDTYFINKYKVLRTHMTSFYNNFFNKYYKKKNIKVISFGKVYRNETLSNKSSCMFYQLDGLCINKNITYSKFLNIILYIYKNIFKNIPFRIRKSYFPFTNLSIEIDVFYNNKWIEILGGGILNNNILKNFNINNNYKGYAFGLGIDRILMIKYNIKDIRLLYNNNIFFLKKFNIF
ncbi:MAG: phenylalanine--tRNA ligase subunit alpha [Candidatus Shikimatogenerans sp. Tduv]|uniref:phenylalanine--tRNA ligase n=1 Tax=Candidatus Shikimatogenerans sp. Tduv TaxID=3158567 RepID=A0AAU7QQV5_9FLAO